MTILRRVAPPAQLPVTLQEQEAQSRVFGDEAIVSRLIAASVAHIDGQGALGRAMITQTWAQWMPSRTNEIVLAMTPFQSLVSIEYYDQDGVLQTADVADFETRLYRETVLILPKIGKAWPSTQNRLDAIKITYTAGYGDTAADVPENVRHAILMLAGHFYENREATTELTLRETPLSVASLLEGEKVAWYG